MTYLFTVIKYNRRYDVYCYKTICLVKSLSQDAAANMGELSLFYLMHLLYLYHQLFIDIERENIPCVLDRVSFIVILAMIYLYSGGSNTERVRNSDGLESFGSNPNHSKTEHSEDSKWPL